MTYLKKNNNYDLKGFLFGFKVKGSRVTKNGINLRRKINSAVLRGYIRK